MDRASRGAPAGGVCVARNMPASGRWLRSGLSLVPETRMGPAVVMVHLGAAGDEAPAEVTAGEWLERHRALWQDDLLLQGVETVPIQSSGPGRAPGGIRMLAYAGWPGALLWLGCALVSQVFVRRGRALVVALAAAVLWLALLDRAVVERLGERAGDPEAGIEQRERALERMRHSFFHAALAEQLRGAVATQTGSP